MKKYYWFQRFQLEKGEWYPAEGVLEDLHPFSAVGVANKTTYWMILCNWKEITEEEYNLFNSFYKK